MTQRQEILRAPRVKLLATSRRKVRGRWERHDLIRCGGGPPIYLRLTWQGGRVLDAADFTTLGEARAQYESGGLVRFPDNLPPAVLELLEPVAEDPPLADGAEALAGQITAELLAHGIHTGNELVYLRLGHVLLGEGWEDHGGAGVEAARERFRQAMARVLELVPGAAIAPELAPERLTASIALRLALIVDEGAAQELITAWQEGPDWPRIVLGGLPGRTAGRG